MPSRKSIANEEGWGDQPALFDTAVEIFRYLLVISPSPELIQVVARLKELVAQRIGPYRGQHSIAHITLLYAYLPIVYERGLCEAIAKGAQGHSPFSLHFSGIKHYPDKKTIYIDPVGKEPITALRKGVRDHLRSDQHLKKLGIHATAQPHLTIARHLGPAQFEPAWDVLAPHELRSEELVSSIVLLRSGVEGNDKHHSVRTFPLE
jgi:2'-5' RNA ligase